MEKEKRTGLCSVQSLWGGGGTIFYSPDRSPNDSIRVTVMGSLLPGNCSAGGEEGRKRGCRDKRKESFFVFPEEEKGGKTEEGIAFDV